MNTIAYTPDGIAYEPIDGITTCDYCESLASGVMSGVRRHDVHAVCPTHRVTLRVEKARHRAARRLMTATTTALTGGDAA